MNAMWWVKGQQSRLRRLAAPGWSWQDVAPFFARIEQGPMQIGRTPYPDELSERFAGGLI
jgi:choline dehydrogenase